MKVFICGGGSGEQTRKALRRLNEVIRHDLPCLYIPLAMEEERYDSCFEWITGELECVEIPGIEMVRSAEELARKRLADYSFLFIGGGNTYKLLNDLKRAHMFEPIREYLRNGGTAFGGSAGAIVFGEDLESCALDDHNEAGLKDTQGFNVLGGISFLCHYTNRSPEQDRRSEEYLLKISDHRKTYALPEEDTLFLNKNCLEEIIDRPYFVFENHQKTEVMPGNKKYTCKIASPEEMNRKWDYEISQHPGEKNWIVWKDEAIKGLRAGSSVPYYGILDGTVICEATAVPFSGIPEGNEGKKAEHSVELCAFRTIREYRGKGYFSKLMGFMLKDLKQKGFARAVVGVEPDEILNREIYRHWGFTERLHTGTETYPDGTVISVEFYGKQL